jgi:hypothetical protein
MKIIAVRIGDRYGPEYETYLESKLPQHEFTWIREPMQDNIQLQWNKMYGMTLDIDEPICVMDIDVLLLGDYNKIFDYPIERGQFLAMPGWWRNEESYEINGGFYKYYPRECKSIFDKFMSDPVHWQTYYIKAGLTSGPVNGEQFFIEDTVKYDTDLELVVLPKSWFARMEARKEDFTKHTVTSLNRKYSEVTGNDFMFLGNEFHPDIKLVHFTNMNNHPTNWEKYHLFV